MGVGNSFTQTVLIHLNHFAWPLQRGKLQREMHVLAGERAGETGGKSFGLSKVEPKVILRHGEAVWLCLGDWTVKAV